MSNINEKRKKTKHKKKHEIKNSTKELNIEMESIWGTGELAEVMTQ